MTPERVIQLQRSFPIPGPNAVRRVRIAPQRFEAVADEVEAAFAGAGLPFAWELDDDTEPADLGAPLERRGYRLSETMACLVLELESAAGRALLLREDPQGVTVEDGLVSQEAFAAAEDVQRLAFAGGPDPAPQATAERYRLARSGPRRLFLARVDGRAAGAGWATAQEQGTYLAGGAVAPEFQGRGVYRALLRARARFAIDARSPGLAVQARHTSDPILRRFGFQEVGRLRHYVR